MDPAKYPAIRHGWPGPGPDPPKKCRVPGGAGAGYPVGLYLRPSSAAEAKILSQVRLVPSRYHF